MTFLAVAALGIAGYKFLAFEFRPMNSLPRWHQPVVIGDGAITRCFNNVGINTCSWLGDTYLVTRYYWVYGNNRYARQDSHMLGPVDYDNEGQPKPLRVSRIRDGNMQPTVSAVGDNNVLINVHPQTGMPHVLMYNLKSHVYTPVKGALSGRGNYLSPAYAVITKSGAVMLNQPDKPARLLYRMPMSSTALLKFVDRCDNRDGNMWDYDPATDRLAYSTSDRSVTMVVGGKVQTWKVPGWVGIQSLYLEPGTHYVWLCEAMWPINWCLVVYGDYGKPLGRSVQGAGIMPWFQPISQRDYQVMRDIVLRSHMKMSANW